MSGQTNLFPTCSLLFPGTGLLHVVPCSPPYRREQEQQQNSPLRTSFKTPTCSLAQRNNFNTLTDVCTGGYLGTDAGAASGSSGGSVPYALLDNGRGLRNQAIHRRKCSHKTGIAQ
jgi:hypothetical protein